MCRASRLIRVIACGVTLVIAAVSRVPAQGPPAPPPEVARAQLLLQGGKADSAVLVLEDFFRRNANAVTGRLLLGNAYRQAGHLDRALSTYLSVTQPRPARVQARYAAALVHAQQERHDAALKLLQEVKASGAFDMDVARSAPELAQLRADARFAAVLWRAEDFANPFVEPVRVIHEWIGETKGDQFSWIARSIADVDGDNVRDVVTSAPTFGANVGPAGPGKVYVYSGRSGRLLWSKEGRARESLGIGLESAGDVNRDGVADVVAGAPTGHRAYVYSGRDGAVLHTLITTDTSEAFGQAAAGAGDVNGDGYADVIVGAPRSGGGRGRAYIYSGRDGTQLHTLDGEDAGDAFGSIVAGPGVTRGKFVVVGAPGAGPRNTGRVYVYGDPAAKPRFTIDSDTTGAALGAMFTSVVGDVDADGTPDIYAADFANSAAGASTGRVYVRSGKDGRPLHTLTGENAGDGFGIGSADVGDINGDGYDDLVVGAWQYSGAAASGGRVYVYSGRDGTRLRTITARVPGETFGFDATGVGDVDGDGVIDLLLTSTWSNIRGFRSGRMFVISGR